MFVIWHEARINFTYRIFSSAHTPWRQYLCVSDWLWVQLFALMHSSQVTFAFHTVCFLTVHAILISILINAPRKCGGNCWLAKANIQTSRLQSHSEFASAVSWDLCWDLFPWPCRRPRQQPCWARPGCARHPSCTRTLGVRVPHHTASPGAGKGRLWSSCGDGVEGAHCALPSSPNCSLAVVWV